MYIWWNAYAPCWMGTSTILLINYSVTRHTCITMSECNPCNTIHMWEITVKIHCLIWDSMARNIYTNLYLTPAQEVRSMIADRKCGQWFPLCHDCVLLAHCQWYLLPQLHTLFWPEIRAASQHHRLVLFSHSCQMTENTPTRSCVIIPLSICNISTLTGMSLVLWNDYIIHPEKIVTY